MENELRYYLKAIKSAIEDETFEPKYLVSATKLPTGAIELAVNTSEIKSKIEYILEAYDEDMKLKTNPDINMENVLIV